MKNDGGPAFPSKKCTELVRDESGQIEAMVKTKNHPGMSLRDYFAISFSFKEVRFLANDEDISDQKARYILADRMLAERDKKD